MESHGVSWSLMESHGVSYNVYIKCHGFYGVSRILMEVDEVLYVIECHLYIWSVMDSHGFSWSVMECEDCYSSPSVKQLQ